MCHARFPPSSVGYGDAVWSARGLVGGAHVENNICRTSICGGDRLRRVQLPSKLGPLYTEGQQTRNTHHGLFSSLMYIFALESSVNLHIQDDKGNVPFWRIGTAAHPSALSTHTPRRIWYWSHVENFWPMKSGLSTPCRVEKNSTEKSSRICLRKVGVSRKKIVNVRCMSTLSFLSFLLFLFTRLVN